MRKPTYLSPSSYSLWCTDRDEFYKKYISGGEKIRFPQNNAMAVGSAFDAYAKSFLHKQLVNDKNPKFEFQTLFEAQVEAQCRDQALIDGKYVWLEYQRNGGLAALMEEMSGCIGPPSFEMDISGVVTGKSLNLSGVPLLGKPDIFFTAKTGARVTHDWKVNGMYDIQGNYHKTGASPKQYYVKSLPEFTSHPKFDPGMHNGILIHKGCGLEDVDETWANQLSIYSWLLGEDIGADFICAIDQLVCRTSKVVGKPNVRTIHHRCLISPDHQRKLFQGLQHCWYSIQEGHIFTDLTFDESQARCKMLDTPAKEIDPELDSFLRER